MTTQSTQKHWILTRLDDNNNEIEMNRFTHSASALAQREEFQARGHKQHYYVYEIDEAGNKTLQT